MLSAYNASYQQSSPGNYSFGFNYKIGKEEANLDYTINLPKLTNDTIYNAVQDMGLTMPHYTYFMSSYEVEKMTNNDLSLPTDLFNFNMGATPIAEIDMMNPAKKNYTLHDFPSVGANSEFESKGATVSEFVIQSSQSIGTSILFSPFLSTIFTLEDHIDDNPAFQNFNKLFSIETVNYPTWSGEKLTHDPTFTVFFITNLGGFPYLYLLIIIGILLGIAISVAVPITYRIYSVQNQEKEIMRKTLSSLSSKEQRERGQKINKLKVFVEDLDSEVINSLRLLTLLEKNNLYDLVGKIYTYLTVEDFWNQVSELELTTEDEIQFIHDMLLLSPSARQEIIHNMLKLKDLDHKKLTKKLTFIDIKVAEKSPPISIDIDTGDQKDRPSEKLDAFQLLDILNQKNAFDLIDNLNLTITAKDFWLKVKELKLSPEDERHFIQDMLSLTPKERQEILDKMLQLKYSNNNDTLF